MSVATEAGPSTAWPSAARLLARWLERRERIDELLETPGAPRTGPERARCQHLVFGVVRHFGRLETELGRLVAHPPRFATRAVLFLAGFELIEAGGKPAEDGLVAKIVHHAVEQTKRLASPAEARLVNAVARKLAAALAGPAPSAEAAADELADYFSHPAWLVRRWQAEFGAEAARKLLEWNQQPATVYGRWRATDEAPPAWLKPTAWAGFFEIPSGHWAEVGPWLTGGKIYLQDPGTRLAVELLALQETETVLDACAAPGGKSLLMADTLQHGKVIALDLPGTRIARLTENLSRLPATVGVALVQGDLLEGAAALLKEHGLPREYGAVLVDVPCSNTGVMRHRVDVKWRLQEGDFKKHPRQQLALLAAAAKLVAPGGRLVYSTCSIDAVENEDVVKEFLADRHGRFALQGQGRSRPWETGHDGAGAFLLRRI
jgi:16S rRNA (cytosine967-C5)-methyltransferase